MSQELVSRPPTNAATVQVSQPQKAVAPAASGCPNLSAALATARDRCKAASKDGRVSFPGTNYAYASADEVIATASEAMNGSGLILIPTLWDMGTLTAGQHVIFSLNQTVMLSHASGEYVALEIRGWPVIPDKGRPLDKALATALTGSLAYLLRSLLQMPRGQEHDMNTRDDSRTQAPAQPNGQPVPPPQQPTAEPVPNPQAPAAAPSPETITAEQRASLATIYREKKRTPQDVLTMLATVNLQALHQLPQALLQWATVILTDGQVSTEQSDRIAALVTTLGIPWQAISARLWERYGVDRLRMLTIPQADEIEKKLLAPRAVPQPAA